MTMLDEEAFTVIEPVADKHFMVTPFVKDLADQALSYLKADLPIHFCGPAGTGKSSLAMYVAAKWGRPIVMIHGDEEFKTSDLVGAEYGYRLKRVHDRYISTVKKLDEDVVKKGESVLSAMEGERPFSTGRSGSVSFVEERGEEKEKGWTRLASFAWERAL